MELGGLIAAAGLALGVVMTLHTRGILVSFQNPANRRYWLDATDAFTSDTTGLQVLTATGQQQIEQVVGGLKDSIVDQPLVVEGYSTGTRSADQLVESRARTLLVAVTLKSAFT